MNENTIRLTLSKEEYQGKELVPLYQCVAEKLGYDPTADEAHYNCCRIHIAANIQDALYDTYRKRAGEIYEERRHDVDCEITMVLALSGPQVDHELTDGMVEVFPEFVCDNDNKGLKQQNTYQFMGKTLDFDKLPTSDELMAYLNENGCSDRVLADFRERLEALAGQDLAWRYPISDGWHAGGSLIPVREGVMFLPYDEVVKEDNELYEMAGASLLMEDAVEILLSEFMSYAEGLCGVLRDTLRILKLQKNARVLYMHPDTSAERNNV